MSDYAIKVNNLEKSFKNLKAVDNISFSVAENTSFGLLGLNGAGKTTTLKMMCGLIKPDNGAIKIAGYDVGRQSLKVRQRIGYVPENPRFYTRMTAVEIMRYIGKLSEIPNSELDKIIEKNLHLVGLEDKRDSYTGTFSRGMRHRLSIAQALLSKPEILFLDEPTSGLDPIGARDIRQLIKTIHQEQKLTIVMSSHTLPEVEQLCDNIAIFNHGKIMAVDNMAGLRNKVGLKQVVEIVLRYKDDKVVNMLSKLDYVKEVQELGAGHILVVCHGEKDYREELLQSVYKLNQSIISFGAKEYNLEDVLFKLLKDTVMQ